MVHDAAHWEARYGDPRRSAFVAPDPAVVAMVEGMPLATGRALDLGCGEGRHALWLAQRGWAVTAVDFSHNGIETARRLADDVGVDLAIDWVVADVTRWTPAHEFDLVLVSLFRLEDEDLARVRGWVRPGGHLVLVAHGDGPDSQDGPRDPRFRSSVEALRARAGPFEVLRCESVEADPAGAPRGSRQRRDRVALLARRPGTSAAADRLASAAADGCTSATADRFTSAAADCQPFGRRASRPRRASLRSALPGRST